MSLNQEARDGGRSRHIYNYHIYHIMWKRNLLEIAESQRSLGCNRCDNSYSIPNGLEATAKRPSPTSSDGFPKTDTPQLGAPTAIRTA
jgi:hypothetical protein